MSYDVINMISKSALGDIHLAIGREAKRPIKIKWQEAVMYFPEMIIYCSSKRSHTPILYAEYYLCLGNAQFALQRLLPNRDNVCRHGRRRETYFINIVLKPSFAREAGQTPVSSKRRDQCLLWNER